MPKTSSIFIVVSPDSLRNALPSYLLEEFAKQNQHIGRKMKHIEVCGTKEFNNRVAFIRTLDEEILRRFKNLEEENARLKKENENLRSQINSLEDRTPEQH